MKLRTFFAAVVCLLLSFGDGPAAPLYPIGIYGVPRTNDFPELREAGFNIVVGSARKDYLDAAKVAGLRVFASPPRRETIERRSMAVLDRHPALWAWYLIDEPDLNLVSPQETRAGYRALKRLDTRKPIALTLFQGYEAANYLECADIVMLDRYPVPWLPLANFGQHMRMGRLALGPRKPMFAIVQAFDWSAYPGMLRGKAELRAPEYEELRCMAYETLARGANGIFFYEFDGTWSIREHPAVWQAVRKVVREVNDRMPLFQAEPLWWGKDHRFEDPATAFNGALESSVTSTLLFVRKGNPQISRGRYIVAVNNTPQKLTYSFLVPSGSGGAAVLPVLDEARELEPSEGRVSDEFDAFAIHVYGPLAQ